VGMDKKQAQQHVAKDMAICASYFFMGSEAAKRNKDVELEKSSKRTADVALAQAIRLSDKAYATKQLEIAIGDHQRIMNNNILNVSILVRKYKDMCKQTLTDPDSRLKFWMNKK